MKTAKQSTAKQSTAKQLTAINAQAGELTVTVHTKTTSAKPSAKAIEALQPLRAAMKVAGDETTVELLARLPTTTIAFKHFASQATSMAALFSWFDDNRTSLTRKTKEGKTLLDIASAYVAAFNIVHDRAVDGPLKNMPFYKKFSNALQQWARLKGGVSQRASGAISDAVAAYLNKKLADNAAELSDSIVAWVLQNEGILQRILDSKAV